jgi:hypothetical protein
VAAEWPYGDPLSCSGYLVDIRDLARVAFPESWRSCRLIGEGPLTALPMDLAGLNYDETARIYYWPAGTEPSASSFRSEMPSRIMPLSDAIRVAATETGLFHVAWILTAGGTTLEPADIAKAWAKIKGAE